MMIDEFTDVNEGEKEIMKMWNHHIMHEKYVDNLKKMYIYSTCNNLIIYIFPATWVIVKYG
jgi:hypothetical protein